MLPLVVLLPLLLSKFVEYGLHILAVFFFGLTVAILVSIYISPRERAWRKWRKKMKQRYGSV